MPLNTAGRNAILTSGAPGITHIGALTDLSTTEVAGGSYARQAVTWAAAASGQRASSGALSIPIPAGTTPLVVGAYDALSAGNLLGIFPYGSAGQVVDGIATVAAVGDLFTSIAHGVTTNDRVWFTTIAGDVIPTGIVITTLYHVIAGGLTADVFAVSATAGGAALDITASGDCVFWKTVPNTFASAGNLAIASGAIVVDATFV